MRRIRSSVRLTVAGSSAGRDDHTAAVIERNPIPDGPSTPKLFQVTFFSDEPDAAAVTALARYTLRALGVQESSPAEILRKLNDALGLTSIVVSYDGQAVRPIRCPGGRRHARGGPTRAVRPQRRDRPGEPRHPHLRRRHHPSAVRPKGAYELL